MGKKEQNIEVELNGIKIESSDCIKLFGVDIDNRLKFNQHVSNVCTKASQRVGVLMRMKNVMPTRAKLQLYKAAILPYLMECHDCVMLIIISICGGYIIICGAYFII